jgi:hypothetical protein
MNPLIKTGSAVVHMRTGPGPAAVQHWVPPVYASMRVVSGTCMRVRVLLLVLSCWFADHCTLACGMINVFEQFAVWQIWAGSPGVACRLFMLPPLCVMYVTVCVCLHLCFMLALGANKSTLSVERSWLSGPWPLLFFSDSAQRALYSLFSPGHSGISPLCWPVAACIVAPCIYRVWFCIASFTSDFNSLPHNSTLWLFAR